MLSIVRLILAMERKHLMCELSQHGKSSIYRYSTLQILLAVYRRLCWCRSMKVTHACQKRSPSPRDSAILTRYLFDNGRRACVFLIGKINVLGHKMCMVTSATYTVADIPPIGSGERVTPYPRLPKHTRTLSHVLDTTII